MKVLRVVLVAVLACGLVSTLATAGDPAAFAGRWEGTIQLPGGELPFVVNLAGEAAKPTGRIDIPAQGIRGMELAGVATDGANVSFSMPGIPGEPTFRGKLSEDGKTLSGNLSQSGQSFPFELARAASTGKEEDPAKLYAPFEAAGAPGQGAEGIWRGILVAGPSKLRLVLDVHSAEGKLTASLDSPDQGAEDLPIATITLEGKALRFEMPMIHASFEGQLNEDGSAIAGQWTQAGIPKPLTWKRAAPEKAG